jgi:predicted phage terminase large subunit-like protein
VKASKSVALPIKKLDAADRGQLIEYWRHCRQMGNEWIRRQVLSNNRIDILAGAVMGLEVVPFHLALLKWQFQHPDNLQLVFRGAGKSTCCTIVKAVHLLLKNPNLRILLASKTSQNAEGFLREIKNHFESNMLLAELFGAYYDSRRVNKWDNREIEVLPRTIPNKEASITCVGADGTIVSKHYDVIISDDLVDEENSRTQHQRNKLRTWYYQTLDPTLEPPDPSVQHRGEHHRQGTRYHFGDLYGHLMDNELKGHTQVIPALDGSGRSPWPKRFPPDWFAAKRKKSGIIIFNAQYQCDTEAMKGEIFQYDDCQQLGEEDWPNHNVLRVFMGIDLAISEEEQADKFAIVVIGITIDRSGYYVLDFYEEQLRFKAQTSKVIEYARRWDPIRIGIETNQYQESQYQNLKDKEAEDEDVPYLPLKSIKTHKDKVTRAWKLSSIFEDKRVYFRKSQAALVEHMVLFPNHRYKDLFDAFDLAVTASKMRRRRGRSAEPGVI